MSKAKKTDREKQDESRKPRIDQYGNHHYRTDMLACGGQGVVYRTKDVDLAVKQPLNALGSSDKLHKCFHDIRLLPLPLRIPISLPLAILRDEPGYVMRLLNGMDSFNYFDMNTEKKDKLRETLEKQERELPDWLVSFYNDEPDGALRLLHYSETGSTRRRLLALSKCASILARLHCAGLVYGDISPNNVFIDDGDFLEVWLIDADNLRFEMLKGGNAAYTPHYGAPEIMQDRDRSRPRTDCWAFAVLAFSMLTLCHPFIGKKVMEPDDDAGGWDAEPAANGIPTDLDEQAYNGYFPFIDDANDDSNSSQNGLPRELVATSELCRLFQETLGVGRDEPHRRPSMAFWAIELARAYDQSLTCPECSMSYFADDHVDCPYCDAPRPAFIRAKTDRWQVLIPDNVAQYKLPHRLFNPFSFEHNDAPQYDAVLNFTGKTATHLRGTHPLPDGLTFDFIEASK